LFNNRFGNSFDLLSTMEIETSFGDWVKKRRKALDLTQNALARQVGCSTATIEKIETGLRRPSHQMAELLAAALEIPLTDRPIFLKVARGERLVERLGGISTSERSPQLSNLPNPPTPLIGRTLELVEIARLLADPDCRLLTLVGTGGIGKTRLAIQAAVEQQAAFPSGVYFVAFAGISEVEFIPLAVAQALNLHFSGQASPEMQLLNYLRDKKLLLVLDNFEHLLSGVDWIDTLLNQAAQVKLLVTSREPLGLQGEWLFDVQGLPMPRLDFEDAPSNSSVALFIQSARRAQASYRLENDDINSVVRICRLVEGMPLGIELAAAWMRTLSSREIAQELERSLDFLSVSRRGLLERHRSLKAVFDQSWNLLSPDEQCTLQQLSVFRGGFTLSAAKQVAETSLSLLNSIISKSLVRRTENGRYDLHEAVRQFAYHHLKQDPEHPATFRRFCKVYLTLLRDREASLRSAAQPDTIRELTGEIDNIHSAWALAIQLEDYDLLGQAMGCFGLLSNIAGWLQEGIDQIEPVVQALRTQAKRANQLVLGKALAQQGLLSFRQGRYDLSLNYLEDSIAVLRPLEQPGPLGLPLTIAGVIQYLLGNFDGSYQLLSQALAASKAGGDIWGEGYAIFNLGYVASLTGRYAEGYQQMLQGLAVWRALGDPSTIALGLNFISPTAIQLGYFEQAQSFLEESQALSRQAGDWWGIGTSCRTLGLLSLAQGEYTQAGNWLNQSLEIFTRAVIGWDIIRSLDYLGRVSLAEGNVVNARQIFMQALQNAMEMNLPSMLPDLLAGLAGLHSKAGEHELALSLALCAAQDPTSIQPTRDQAAWLASQAEAHLSPQQIEFVKARATRITPKQIATAILNGDSLPD
jgi:predicted ATPase/DNA-binding XRE family transcriptional regulator